MGKTTEMTAKRAKKTTARKKVAKKTTRTTAERTAKKTAAKKAATKAVAPKKPAAKAKAPAKKVIKKVTATKKKARRRAAAGSGANQRAHERHVLPDVPEIEVELLGYQRDGREFGVGLMAGPGRKFRTSGVTSNLSLSGMLARVADELTQGSHCLVRFIDVSAGVRPEHRWGLVLRSRQLENGECEVAVKFDSPLELLDVEALLAA